MESEQHMDVIVSIKVQETLYKLPLRLANKSKLLQDLFSSSNGPYEIHDYSKLEFEQVFSYLTKEKYVIPEEYYYLIYAFRILEYPLTARKLHRDMERTEKRYIFQNKTCYSLDNLSSIYIIKCTLTVKCNTDTPHAVSLAILEDGKLQAPFFKIEKPFSSPATYAIHTFKTVGPQAIITLNSTKPITGNIEVEYIQLDAARARFFAEQESDPNVDL